MYKVKNGLSPDYKAALFNTVHKGYSLRNADCNVPRFSSGGIPSYSIRFFGPYMWSKLNSCDRQRTKPSNFKMNTMMQRTANENAARLRRIFKRSHQPKIERLEDNDARLILRRKLNGTTTR